MKKTLKKSKKIIILSVVLLAFFCFNAFKSAYFSPAVTVSAEEEQTRDITYYNLDDLGLNLCFNKVYYQPIEWGDLQITGSGNLFVDEKTINNSDTNFTSLTVKKYYNQISGTGGELIRFTKDTIIEFDIDDDLFSHEIVAVFDFRDTQNNTYNFIAQFMDITKTNSINFSDMTINGVDFPTDENDDIFTRFKFYGVMVYYATPFGSSYRSETINPCFYVFYERTAENAYSARSTAFLTLVNCRMFNYNGGQTNKFKFDSMICQISGISYNSAYYTVAQQPSNWYSNDTKYIIKYTPEAHENSVYFWGDSPAATFSDTDCTLYRVFLETPDAPIEITNYNLEVPKENWNLLTVWGDLPEEDGTSINLISNTATGNNIVTEFMELFHISIPIENYVPTPEPEPEPEPEPDYNSWEAFGEDIGDLIKQKLIAPEPDKTPWLGWIVASTAIFGIGGLIAAGMGLVGESFADAGGATRLNEVINYEYNISKEPNVIAKIGKIIGDFTKWAIETTGVLIRGFLDALGVLDPLQKYGSIALMIFGILFSAGLIGYIFIKKRN